MMSVPRDDDKFEHNILQNTGLDLEICWYFFLKITSVLLETRMALQKGAMQQDCPVSFPTS